ncbi:hypothetical protein ACVW1A_007829 [Bradyrhizobium sp. LB1.3]
MPNKIMPPIQINAEAARTADVPTPMLPARPNSVPALNRSPTTPQSQKRDVSRPRPVLW